MDIKSLILEIKEEKEEATKAQTIPKKDVSYEIEIASGCDCAIRRKTNKTSQLLVLLVSQKQYYIKNEKNGDVKPLTVDDMTRFFADLESPLYIGLSWTNSFKKGKPFADNYMQICEQYTDLAKYGYIVPLQEKNANWNVGYKKYFAEDPTLFKWVMKYFESIGVNVQDLLRDLTLHTYRASSKQEEIVNSFDVLITLKEKFGIEWAKYYVEAYMGSTITSPIEHSVLKEILKDRQFDAKTFVDYMVYECCRQGQRAYPRNFYHYWCDVLSMQEQIYGKIREKYPDNLSTFHDQLADIRGLRRQEIDRRMFANAAERMQRYTWKPAGMEYQIVAPLKPEDMYDEAQQQQNCLASYVKAVTEGEKMIFFLRKAKEEEKDKSIVTIEVYPNGAIGQVKARNNAEPEEKHMRFVNKWANQMGFYFR